jgi:molecular chaperone Hsp33
MVTEGIAPTADRALGFMVPARNARGMVVRLDATLNAILAAHAYPEPLIRLLAEALTLTALVGATMRQDDGQVTVRPSPKNAGRALCRWKAMVWRRHWKAGSANPNNCQP